MTANSDGEQPADRVDLAAEDALIPLSALQHYLFCPRQCALIHVEQAWAEDVATAEGRADELDPVRISQRLLPLNFAAIHTTAITTLHAFLDFLGYDKEQNIIETLREEINRILGEEPAGEWTKCTKCHTNARAGRACVSCGTPVPAAG